MSEKINENTQSTELSLEELEAVSGGAETKPKACKCLICGKLFPSELQLAAHATTHFKKD